MVDAPTSGRISRRSTAGHVIGFVGGRVIAAAISACTGLILPRMLGVEDAAAYGVAVGIAMMLVVVTDLGCTTSLARFLADGTVSRATIWRAVAVRYSIAVACALALVGIGSLAAIDVISLGSMRPQYLQLAGMLCLASSIPAMASGLLPALRGVRALLVMTIVQPMLELAGIIGVVMIGGGGGHVMIASSCAALIVGIVGMSVAMRAAVRRSLHLEREGDDVREVQLRAVLSYGVPMFIVAICFAIFGQIDQILLYSFAGPIEAAPYIWNWRLIALINLPTLAVATIVAPRIRTPGSAMGRELYEGWLRILAVVSAGLAGMSMFLAPWLVPVALGREKYGASWTVLVALGGYAFLLGVAPLVTMAANFLGGARRRVGIGLVTVGTNALLDLLLIPRFGVYGAAIATTIAFGWFVGAHMRLTSQLIVGDVGEHDRSRVRIVGLVVVVSMLLVAVGGVANMTARWIDEMVTARYDDLLALAVGGVPGFALFIFTAWRLLARYGVDLSSDLRRESRVEDAVVEDASLEGAA